LIVYSSAYWQDESCNEFSKIATSSMLLLESSCDSPGRCCCDSPGSCEACLVVIVNALVLVLVNALAHCACQCPCPCHSAASKQTQMLKNQWQKQKRLNIRTNQNLRAWTSQRFQTKSRGPPKIQGTGNRPVPYPPSRGSPPCDRKCSAQEARNYSNCKNATGQKLEKKLVQVRA
jgi:hypothetical protein